MKNKYNYLVIILMIVCFIDAGYRLYKTYKMFENQQGKLHGIFK